MTARTTKRRGSGGRTAGAAVQAPPSGRRDTGRPQDGTHQLEVQLQAVRAIGAAMATAVGLDSLLDAIVPHVSALFHAERTTLFLYDAATNEVWSKVAEGEHRREIRLALGEGLAGWCAAQRRTLAVTDAYKDPRFRPDVDAKTGFRTRSVAAVPLVDRRQQLLGVLEVLNCQAGAFTDDDIALLGAIGTQAAFAVENARLAQEVLDQNRALEAARHRAERRRAELDLLYQIERETSASTDLDQLLDSMIVRVCKRLRSQAGSVLLTDRDTGRLYFRGVAGRRKRELQQMTLEPGEGIVGWVARSGEPLVVNRPEEDPRHDSALALKIDFPARALLAVPLVWDQRVVGAVEVLNPTPRPSGATGYDREDLKVLTLIAGQLARAVALTVERQARIDTERLAVIGRMLAGVAHDLRDPMNTISGYAQLMTLDADAAVRQQRCERILAQVDEMTAMIGDLLAFARGDTKLHPSTVDLERLASESEETLRPHCNPRGITLALSTTGGTAVIDAGRTKRILFNLAKNAVDVLRAGGTLSIDLTEKNGGLALRVADDGPGIPPEVRSRLFEPFVTAQKTGGTGLGLSIVKRFVEDHGGAIEVESEANGTTFVVQLPRIQSVAQG